MSIRESFDIKSTENLSPRLAEILARPRDKTFYRDLLAFARDNRPEPTWWEKARFFLRGR